MKRLLILTCVAAMILALAPLNDAMGEGPKLPRITGGGVTQNNNSTGGTTPELLNVGGFTAQATGPGVVTSWVGVAWPDAVVYPAKGEIQMKTVSADDPKTTIVSFHGKVVCMANLGRAGDVDGGGNEDLDVWEIRFQITKAPGLDLFPAPIYGSIFVQDGGKTDFADENFAFVNLNNPNCLGSTQFQLEPHIAGNISVK